MHGDETFPAKIGATPWSVPAPFMIDSSAARVLGFAPQSYEAIIGAVCAWLVGVAQGGDWLQQFPVFTTYPDNPFDYEAEDVFLASADD